MTATIEVTSRTPALIDVVVGGAPIIVNEAGGSTITVSDSDPGATGAGSGWLLIDGSGNPMALFIRNNADDGWLSDGALPLGALDVTVEVVDDLEVGIGGGVFARQIVTPLAVGSGYVTLFSARFEGDDFPRVLLVSDGSLYIGDGTFNPLQNPNGVTGILPSGAGIRMLGDDAGVIVADGFVRLKTRTLPVDIVEGGVDFVTIGEPSNSPGGILMYGRDNGAGTAEMATKDQSGLVTSFLRLFPTLPADADIPAGGLTAAFDSTNGAASLDLKGKTDDGTVVNGSVALA